MHRLLTRSGAFGLPGTIGIALGLAVLMLPELAQACPVCSPAQEENRIAFIVTTGIMTVFPLVMVGAAVFWLRARFRALDRVRESVTDRSPTQILPLEV